MVERTRAFIRLHVVLRYLLSDGVAKDLSAEAAATLLCRVRPNHAAGRTRKSLAFELASPQHSSRQGLLPEEASGR